MRRRRIRARTALLFLVFLGALTMLPFHGRIRSFVLEQGLLGNDSPDPMLVEDTINASPHAQAAILAAWSTGRITQREKSIHAVRNIVSSSHHIPAGLMPLVEGPLSILIWMCARNRLVSCANAMIPRSQQQSPPNCATATRRCACWECNIFVGLARTLVFQWRHICWMTPTRVLLWVG